MTSIVVHAELERRFTALVDRIRDIQAEQDMLRRAMDYATDHPETTIEAALAHSRLHGVGMKAVPAAPQRGVILTMPGVSTGDKQ